MWGVCVCVHVHAQSCPTLCDPMDYSPPASSVNGIFQARPLVKVKVTQLCPTVCNPMDYTAHGILQARILEWLAFLFSRGSFWSRNLTRISCIAGGFFINWAMREAQDHWSWLPFPSLRNLPDLGIESHLLHWQADFLPLHHLGSHDKVHDCQIWSPGYTTEDNQVETRGKGAGFNL